MGFGNKIKLRYAIGILVLMSVILTAIVAWYSSMSALKRSLTENYLESNSNYARKLSLSTGDLIGHMQQNLTAIGETFGKSTYNQADLDAWRAANNKYFNSLFITDSNGVIQLISPAVIQFNKGYEVKANIKVESEAVQRSLALKKPLISEPYKALSGQRILLMTAPIFDEAGQYKGLIAGTIYLESDNVIKNTMNDHQYANGSYVYVVDQKGRIIFHPDAKRINDNVMENPIVEKVISGKSGQEKVMNTEGNQFFAGYAYEKKTGWGIISQTPISVIEEPLESLSKSMIIQSLPLLLVILILAWVLGSMITRPINKLAKFSENALRENSFVPFKSLKINTSIFEVHYLYHHINNYFNLLNKQIQIDGLTGLYNRKTFDSVMKEFIAKKVPFSLILLDIDHFKKVNDTYGHLVGDEVLKYLAKMIESIATPCKICFFRYGGEEFVILTKSENANIAFDVAEKLRIDVAGTPSPTGKPITISLGVTSVSFEDQAPEEIISRADEALYESKTTGRNKTTVFNSKYKNIV
ncbi:diguanylate cyclase (GGDEF) domain-containing protein [Schinkia azotoformans MEV2011]|uniref:Diguanylate cyclase (GGDEF) domain-containing protein n=2 Tax=Schinkia azotoformans TaxID=1454 RepID=A0A072NS35_SCHAZ|nr:sensor domain-containing diguanylate cyclase [Schinkia azotoformans]KEF40281.1 diguanylate cyclase (GGDEF) domain-containing protein [Schinkia azotoformans MEV2011]MEC1696410.1 sensor domain-containing diguanylate cyclase [Schinkia azotoformans]MEC1715202.1 sensor domain-containing diguanylate cyclase [Schinkia azotoformans]MEC1724082.1 sensor domain-containing diguanylate cyclase [Schinkia azotoformans]MEC1739749.1 sensor domain-containing diguanylate cyclase [Schinkia azotoformans]